MTIRCGIDLGTTYSSISWYDTYNNRVDTIDLDSADGAKVLRSVVFFPEDGDPPVVGNTAWRAYPHNPDRVEIGIKRAMGSDYSRDVDGKFLVPQQISAEILKTITNDAQTYLGEEVKDVVITVPAYFGDNERAATEEAGTLAGLNVLALLPEPHAAALAYAVEKVADIVDRHLLIYDLGGGTFDVTLVYATTQSDQDGSTNLTIETLAKEGDAHLGGLDWDRVLCAIVSEKILDQFDVDPSEDPRNEPILMDNCEKAKRDLSRISQVSIVGDLAGHQVDVTLSEFEDRTRDLLYRTQLLLEQVYADAYEKHGIEQDQIEVMLCGGSSRMPMVRRMLRTLTGKEPLTHRNPELLVTIGAAYWSFLLQPGAKIPTPDGSGGPIHVNPGGLSDTSAYDVGIEVYRSDGQGGFTRFNSLILPCGTVYGEQISKEFRTAEDGSTELLIRLLKGDAGTADTCEILAEFTISGLPPNRPRGQPVHLTLGYDSSGILQGSAVDVNTGIQCDIFVDRTRHIWEV